MTETQVNPEHVRTFDDARIAAWVHLQDGWPVEELGVLTIAPWGWESPDRWGVTVTNEVADGVFVVVDKRSGQITEPPWTEWLEQRDRMAKVGDWMGVE